MNLNKTFRKNFKLTKSPALITSHLKVKMYKEVLKEECANFIGAEDLINLKIGEICSREKLSVKEVIDFLLMY